MVTDYIVSGAIILVILVALIISIVRIVKKAKIRAEEQTREVNDVIEKKGVRYTPNATIVDEKGNESSVQILQTASVNQGKTDCESNIHVAWLRILGKHMTNASFASVFEIHNVIHHKGSCRHVHCHQCVAQLHTINRSVRRNL